MEEHVEDKPTRPALRPTRTLERTHERTHDGIARTVQAMLHSASRAEPGPTDHAAHAAEPRASTPSRPRVAWRALGDWRAVLAGTAVVCTAALFGPLEAGVLGLAAYRTFLRDPLAAALTDEEALAQLSESLLQRIGKALVRSTSRVSTVLYAIEIGGMLYLGIRVLRRWRVRRRRARGGVR